MRFFMNIFGFCSSYSCTKRPT